MNEKMLEGLSRAEPIKRYKTFITTVADRENIWLHMSDVWSVWPYGEFPALMFPSTEVLCLDVHVFCDEYLSKAATLSIRVNVFPTYDNSGLVVSPEKLRSDLREELDRLE